MNARAPKLDEMLLIDGAGHDEAAEAARDIETFAQVTIEFAGRAADDGMIAPAYVPEALLLAAVELAARHDSDPRHAAEWLERVAVRLREHAGPQASATD